MLQDSGSHLSMRSNEWPIHSLYQCQCSVNRWQKKKYSQTFKWDVSPSRVCINQNYKDFWEFNLWNFGRWICLFRFVFFRTNDQNKLVRFKVVTNLNKNSSFSKETFKLKATTDDNWMIFFLQLCENRKPAEA